MISNILPWYDFGWGKEKLIVELKKYLTSVKQHLTQLVFI